MDLRFRGTSSSPHASAAPASFPVASSNIGSRSQLKGKVAAEPKQGVRFSELRILHLAAFVVFFYEAIVSAFFAEPYLITVSITSVVPSPKGELLPTIRPVARFSMQYLLALYFIVAGAHHLISTLPPFFTYYVDSIQRECNPFRWIEYAVSAPVVSMVMCLLIGICDMGTLFYLAGAIAVANMFGYCAEIFPDSWIPHFLGWVVYMPFWIYIFWFLQFVDNLSQIARIVLLINLTTFTAFGLNQFLHKCHFGIWANYAYVEVTYIFLSVLCKSTIGYSVFTHLLSG